MRWTTVMSSKCPMPYPPGHLLLSFVSTALLMNQMQAGNRASPLNLELALHLLVLRLPWTSAPR